MTVVDDYQSSDILGGKSPVGPGRVPQGPFTARNFYILLVVGVVGAVAFHQSRAWFRKWQEERRRLAYRRRNGIPDSDHRAFNVAYAAAQRAKENGAPKRPLFPTLKEPSEPRAANGGDLRQRSNNAISNHASHSLTAPMGGQFNGGLQPAWESRPSFPQQPSPQIPGYLQGLSSTDLSSYQVNTSPAKGRETSKTASGDTPPQAHAQNATTYNTPEDGPSDLFIRKPKRSANPTSDEGETPSPEFNRHDKRRRKVSNKYIAPSEPADVEMDDVSELPPVLAARGKKRDRAEAGSTMGDEDAAELGVELHRRRRRKHRQSGLVPTRGQKRDRASDVTSEDESDGHGHRLRGKSTRRRQNQSSPSSEDAMAEDEPVVLDPACKGRKVGEVWELHGKTYKVGPSGRRLTRSFIKTDAPVYNMPTDSQHPDRDISREIFIEQWLTDEEYKDASDRQVHAHQSPVKPTISTELARQIKAPLENAGKQMLWQLSTVPTVSSPLKSSFGSLPASPRRSIPGTPLPPPPVTPGAFRRVTSGLVPAGKAVESPRGPRLSLTKMQKQEREAALYGEIRRKEEEARVKAKEEEEAKRKAMAPPPVPAIAPAPAPAATPAPSAVASTSAPAAPLFKMPAAPTKPAETPSATAIPAEPAKSTFSFPSSSGASSSLFPKPADKPADKPPQPQTAPSFSFGPASSSTPAPASTPAASATNTSSNIPNFFGNRGHSGTPTATTAPAAPKPAVAPAPAAPTPPTLFNFGGTASSTPAAPTPQAQPSAAPAFSFPVKQDNASPFGAKPASPFGVQPAPSNASAPEPAKEAPKPVFNFASSSKPASPAPGATPANATPAAEAPKPAPTFSFGASKPATTAVAPEPAAPKPAPALSFGGGSGQSAFGSASTANPFGQTKAASPAPAPATAGASNPFGSFASKPADNAGKAAEKPASPFGSFGNASANNADKGKEGEKPAFAFGSFGTAENKAKEADKPASAFGSFGPANGAKSAFGGGSSVFGSGSGAASPFASSSTPTPVAGSTESKPATFSFGASSTPQFGASDKPATQAAPAAKPASGFGVGTNPNANSSSSSSPFGAPAQNGGAFGSSAFGGSTGAFGASTSGTASPFGMPTPTADQPAKSASFSFGSSNGTSAFGAKPGAGSFSFGSAAANGEKKEPAPAPSAFSFGGGEKK